jgi:hypothetical protein
MNLEPNRKLFPDHLPSILHGVMVHSGPYELLDPIGTFYTKVLHICSLTPLREREREREREHIPRALLEAPFFL